MNLRRVCDKPKERLKCETFNQSGGGQGGGGGSLGEKGARGVWEAEKEGVGSGIPKVMGSRRNRGELCNTVQYFAIEKSQRGGRQQK